MTRLMMPEVIHFPRHTEIGENMFVGDMNLVGVFFYYYKFSFFRKVLFYLEIISGIDLLTLKKITLHKIYMYNSKQIAIPKYVYISIYVTAMT